MIRSKDIIAIPPGYTIKEQLEDRGIKQKEFALRMEMSEKHISKLINGEVLLTMDVAFRLEMVLGIPADFWINLEAIYREKEKRISIINDLEDEKILASKFPYKDMVSLGWIDEAKNKEDRVINLRKYFEVNRLGLLFENDRLNVLCRRLSESEKSDYALMAWAQKAKIEARNLDTKTINVKGLESKAKYFRKMTSMMPSEFMNELTNILSNYGVALIVLPYIGGSLLHGATFNDANKIVMALSLRGKDSDKFWFSFYHELAHIVLGHVDMEYYDKMEEEADEFAKNILIPKKEYDEFVYMDYFSDKTISIFANNIGVDPSIVVGRLQKEKYIQYSAFNYFKKKYELDK